MQILQAISSPLALFKGCGKSYFSLATYTLLAVAVFGLTAWATMAHEQVIRQSLYAYLFPQSWHWMADKIVGFFFEAQTRVVLASFIISGALVVASALLFPIKEWCSASFEKKANPSVQFKEFPLWMQGLEELKLLTLYIAAQSVVLAIGYYPYDWCKVLSSVLGMGVLFFTFGLDFLSPAFQRHRVRYVNIVHTLLKAAPAVLLFGAIFSAPLLFLGQWIIGHTKLSLLEVSAWLFLLNILCMAWAIPAGTQLGSKLRQNVLKRGALKQSTIRNAYIGVTAAAILGVAFHSTVALSIHHKSQILKCEYEVNWESFNTNLTSLKALFFGKETAQFTFDLTIHNPTAFDVDIEHSTLSIWQNSVLISKTQLEPIAVASGKTAVHPIQINTQMDLNNLSHWRQLTQGWEVFLEFEVLPGIPFMLALAGQS